MPVELRGNRVVFTAPDGASALVGDFSDWMDAPVPIRPGQTVELEFPRAGFIEYGFLDAKGEPFADPANPVKTENPWWTYPRGVVLEGYVPDPLREPLEGAPAGRAERLVWEGRVFEGTRRAYVYLPAGYDAAFEYPVVYVQDGVAFYRTGRLGSVMDNLVHLGRAQPTVLVFLEPADRTREYALNDAYLEFLLGEALPEIEQRFNVAREPQRRGLWGASLGGLISMYAALRHPDSFGLVVAQSGAFQALPNAYERRAPEWLIERYAGSPRLPLRVALECGQLEWLLGSNRRMAGVLFDKGYAHRYEERSSGHNWITWRNGLAASLEYLLPA